MLARKRDWLSCTEAARRIGVDRRTLSVWSQAGKGPAFHWVGSVRRYYPADVEAWLNAQPRGGEQVLNDT